MYVIDVNGDNRMGDEKIKSDDRIEQELSKVKADCEKIQFEKNKTEESFQAYKKETDAKLEALALAKTKAETDKFTLSIASQKLTSPSMIPLIEVFLNGTTMDTYTVG